MRIGGVTSLNAYQSYSLINKELSKSITRLSSGLRITEAADDPAGMAVAEKMRAQIRGSKQAFQNVQYGMSMIYVAENAMKETSSILQRMRELSVQAANGILSDTDRSYVELEFSELKSELDRINNVTEYNGRKMLRDHVSLTLQIGANENDEVDITFISTDASSLGLDDISASTVKKSSVTISVIDKAIDVILMNRAQLGGYFSRLEHTCNLLSNYITNLSDAENNIIGVDMMKEIVNFTKLKIVSNTEIAFMSQANQIPGVTLSLLKNSI
jgi:flagellin